ncbi:hypothetical protein [Salsuginibacillus kocurii]|uniref:hypothetical protein n=1 Tax=Salsuginibacillus kocurii TaxID=427078 RepID=UPI0003625B98|nr:hypothetical protein [Salsuginibacillus kocurii]
MYRLVSFIVLFTFVGGLLYLYTLNSHFVMTVGSEHEHEDTKEVTASSSVPSLSGTIEQETEDEWVIEIDTENFTFTREESAASSEDVWKGHAHVYVNGEQEGRIYGDTYYLGKFHEGEHDVEITLFSPQHKQLTYEGEPIRIDKQLNIPE